MQKYDVSNFIISNLLFDLPAKEKPLADRVVINNLVDGWNNNIYFYPKDTTGINHYIPQNHHLM